MTKRTKYTEEFKRQAVEMLENRDQSATDLARELVKYRVRLNLPQFNGHSK